MMSGDKMPTREECLQCVKDNRALGEVGKEALETIMGELKQECQKEKEACLLEQETLANLEQEQTNELGNEQDEI